MHSLSKRTAEDICVESGRGTCCRYESPGQQPPPSGAGQARVPQAVRASQLSFDPAPRGSGYELTFDDVSNAKADTAWVNGRPVNI